MNRMEELTRKRDVIEEALVNALKTVDQLRAERLRVHNAIGEIIGAPPQGESA